MDVARALTAAAVAEAECDSTGIEVEARSSPSGARCEPWVNAGSMEASSGAAKRQQEPASSEGTTELPLRTPRRWHDAGTAVAGVSIRQVMA